MHWRRKWQPTPVFLPGGSQGQGAWWAAVYGVAQSRTRLKRLSSSSKVTRLINWWCWNLTTDYFESKLNGAFSYYTGSLKRWSTASTTGLHGASGWKSRHSFLYPTLRVRISNGVKPRNFYKNYIIHIHTHTHIKYTHTHTHSSRCNDTVFKIMPWNYLMFWG